MTFETTIDRFGRIVLPKGLRSDHGLEPGSVVAIEEEGDNTVLKPRREEPALVKKGAVLVYAGKATTDLTKAVRTLREARLTRFRKGARR
jgi:AbrB family looped-hinge helix DNA binding protein